MQTTTKTVIFLLYNSHHKDLQQHLQSEYSNKVDENGICASPNDVLGYDKELYMVRSYTYEDRQENKYGYGLSYQ